MQNSTQKGPIQASYQGPSLCMVTVLSTTPCTTHCLLF
uniref:Uncharacterized protein n=1 Tax=Anguilla anguilla TaxID=7936 RepID=A0A0E9VJK8_ANGAN